MTLEHGVPFPSIIEVPRFRTLGTDIICSPRIAITTDLHTHTRASDGKNSLREMVEKGKSEGIHVIAVTNHIWKGSGWESDIKRMQKEFDENREFLATVADSITVLKGAEITTPRWHLLMVGIRSYQMIDDYFSRKKSFNPFALKNILQFAKDHDIYTIAAHPLFPEGIHSMSMKALEKSAPMLHGMEVHNGEYFRKLPSFIYQCWTDITARTAERLKLLPFTGSDAHADNHIGMGTEVVLYRYQSVPCTEENTMHAIMHAESYYPHISDRYTARFHKQTPKKLRPILAEHNSM